MRALLRRILTRGSSAHGIMALFSGSVAAQIVPFAAAPLLTRLYAPHEFGVLALFLAIATLIGVISTARYEMAVMLPESDDDALMVVCLAFLVCGAVTLVTAVVVVPFSASIATTIGSPRLASWIPFIPIFVLSAGIQQTLSYWNARCRAFGRVAGGNLTQAGVDTGVTLGAGFAGLGVGGLIAGATLGRILAAVFLAGGLRGKIRHLPKHVSLAEMHRQARRYSDMPRVNTLHAFADMAQRSVLHLGISSMFGATALGLYSYTVRNVRAPLNLITGSIAQVFFQSASKRWSNGETLGPLVRQTMAASAPLALGAMVALLCAGPEIFAFVFGSDWRIAGEYARRLAPMLFLSFFGAPVSSLPIVVNKQRPALAFSIYGHAAALVLFFLSRHAFDDMESAISVYSATMTLYLALLLLWYTRIAQQRPPDRPDADPS